MCHVSQSGTPVEVDFFTKKNIQVGAGHHRHTAQWEPFLKPIYHTVLRGKKSGKLTS